MPLAALPDRRDARRRWPEPSHPAAARSAAPSSTTDDPLPTGDGSPWHPAATRPQALPGWRCRMWPTRRASRRAGFAPSRKPARHPARSGLRLRLPADLCRLVRSRRTRSARALPHAGSQAAQAQTPHERGLYRASSRTAGAGAAWVVFLVLLGLTAAVLTGLWLTNTFWRQAGRKGAEARCRRAGRWPGDSARRIDLQVAASPLAGRQTAPGRPASCLRGRSRVRRGRWPWTTTCRSQPPARDTLAQHLSRGGVALTIAGKQRRRNSPALWDASLQNRGMASSAATSTSDSSGEPWHSNEPQGATTASGAEANRSRAARSAPALRRLNASTSSG